MSRGHSKGFPRSGNLLPLELVLMGGSTHVSDRLLASVGPLFLIIMYKMILARFLEISETFKDHTDWMDPSPFQKIG